LTERDDLSAWADWWGEAEIADALARRRHVPIAKAGNSVEEVAGAEPATFIAAHDNLPAERRHTLSVPFAPNAIGGLRCEAYPEFGHYVIAGPKFFLALRCRNFDGGKGPGHAHDDALAMELQIDGKDLIVDPGTYVYTPLPAERNRYRAAAAHFVPRPRDAAGADFSAGLFAITNLPASRCLYFGRAGFVGEAWGPGWKVARAVALHSDRLVVADMVLEGASAGLWSADEPPPVCIGYGQKTARSSRSV
jgi:hypothetical protein